MRSTVTGATELIESRLVAALRARGDEVTALSRNPDHARAELGDDFLDQICRAFGRAPPARELDMFVGSLDGRVAFPYASADHALDVRQRVEVA